MQKLITLTLALASIFSFHAQQEAPPQGINYQAVAVDNSGKETVGIDVAGKPVAEKEIRVRFSILKTSETGTLTYREVHLVTTDAYGLFNTVIGQGIQDASPNAFNQIDWGTGYHFLKVEIDIKGGTEYKDMGTQQLWSVPYALYSKYADVAGNGIETVSDNGDGTLTFTYIDGSTYTTSPLTGLTGPQGPAGEEGPQGPAGPAGANGQDGLSAYEVWLAEGNTGTEADFLAGITGPQGPQGIQGEQGVQGEPGLAGPAGANGQDGLSAYEIWLAEGNTGTETDFLNGITGPQGPQGVQGEQGIQGIQGEPGLAGANGQDGLSAYEIWLAEGNTGTEADFLAGITGPQGTPGSQDAWSLTGNAGMSPATNFIGTTDAQDWVVKTDNTERLRVTSSGNVGVGISTPNGTFHAINTNGSIRLSSTGATWIERSIGLPLIIKNGNNDDLFGYSHIEFQRGNGTGNSASIVTTGDANNGISNFGINVGGSTRMNILANGNVGIGTSSPTSKLEVNGAATNATAFNAGTSSTIDFAQSNLAYTSATGTAITLQNLKNGGAYTLIFTNNTASGTVNFTASGFTFVQMGTFARTAGKKHIYNFVIVGTEVYVTMAREN
jgi:hypothetical protein